MKETTKSTANLFLCRQSEKYVLLTQIDSGKNKYINTLVSNYHLQIATIRNKQKSMSIKIKMH